MTTKTLESAYVHISNSGLSLKVTEDAKDVQNPTWRFHVGLNAFGTGVKFEFPLVPSIVRWTREALERVEARMATFPDPVSFAFRNSKAEVSFRDGEPVKVVKVESYYSSESDD